MQTQLLDILVEPKTYHKLTLKDAIIKEDQIEEGLLVSTSGNVYPITNGIARFVKMDNYNLSFGLQWNRFAKTQLDSVTGCGYSRTRFNQEVGWSGDWAKGKWILDAGCGAGRFAEIAAPLNCNLVAIDMSTAIDAAKTNLSRFLNINFIQADLNQPPFRPGTFAGLYCIGVLQHTPDPYIVLASILQLVSPQGKFAFTIYANRPWTKLYAKYWARKITCRIEEEKVLGLIEGLMPFAFAVTDILFRIPVLGKIIRFLVPIANYVEKTDMTKQQRYEESVLDTYDMLASKYDNPVIFSSVIEVLKKYKVKSYRVLSKRPVNIIGER